MSDPLDEFMGLLDRFFEELPAEFTPALEAEAFIARVRRENSAALDAWLSAKAVVFLTVDLSKRLHNATRRARDHAEGRAFASAATEFEQTGAAASFDTWLRVDDDNLRRRVADMTGRDHLFVANRYKASGNRMLMLATFHHAIAKKVGMDKRTGDVISEDDYDRLYGSLMKLPKSLVTAA